MHLLILSCLSMLVVGIDSLEMVKLRSSNAGWPKTSSTLKWQQTSVEEKLPMHTIPVDYRNPSVVWCRGMVNGINVAGSTSDKGCELAFFSITIAKDFDALVSVNGSARIKKVNWDSLMAKPENALLSPDRYLVLVSDPNDGSSHVAASLGTRNADRRASGIVSKKVKEFSRGEVLVEDEPISYKLRDISFEEKYAVTNKIPIQMNSTQLINLSDVNKIVRSTISYTIPETIYYGKPKGTLSALKSTISSPGKLDYEVQWGQTASLKRVEFSSLEYELPPRSAVNVTIVGNMMKYEAPYSGLLTSIYDDGFETERTVSSFHTSQMLAAAVAQYSSPFFLNGSIIEKPEHSELIYEKTTTTTTTTSTTTSTTPTTTKTTTTTTTSLPPTRTKETTTKFSSPHPNSLEANAHRQSSSPKLIVHYPNNRESLTEPEEMPNPIVVENSKSTSDRILAVLSTIFTGLVFWYFSLGVTV